MTRHAIASDDKHARRKVMLEVAKSLFVAGDGSLPAAAQIADAAGLAKGTLYLYFRTKEEIFATLLLESWSTFLDEVEVTFKSTRGKRDAKVVAFLATYVRYLDEHPELLRLDALGYGVLEQNLGPAELREYKAAFTKRLSEVGVIIDDALRLSAGHGTRLLTRTYALTRGLWQSSRPCETPDASQAESALAPLDAYFGEELREALGEYWRGALA